MFSKTTLQMQSLVWSFVIGHFGLLKDVNISFFFFHIFSLSLSVSLSRESHLTLASCFLSISKNRGLWTGQLFQFVLFDFLPCFFFLDKQTYIGLPYHSNLLLFSQPRVNGNIHIWASDTITLFNFIYNFDLICIKIRVQKWSDLQFLYLGLSYDLWILINGSNFASR